jgi:hypothetical protein
MSHPIPPNIREPSPCIRDLVYVAFPEGEAREHVLFDSVKQFSKMARTILNGCRLIRAYERQALIRSALATDLRVNAGFVRGVFHKEARWKPHAWRRR